MRSCLTYLKVVAPEVMIVENVTGLLMKDVCGMSGCDYFSREAGELGYFTEVCELDLGVFHEVKRRRSDPCDMSLYRRNTCKV